MIHITRLGARLCKDMLASRSGNVTLRRPRVRLHLDPGTLRLSRSRWWRPGAHPAAARQYAVRSDHAGTRRQHRDMGAAPNPRVLTGWFGASSPGLWVPVRAFLRFPVCPPGAPPLRPPSSSVPSSGVLRFGPFGRRCQVRFPAGFPPGSLTLEPPSRLRCRQAVLHALVRCGRDQSHQFPARSPDPIAPGRPQRRCSPGADRVPRRGGAWRMTAYT
jgi:hypothetical protein